MAKGLDVGTMNILSARQEGDETVFVQQRNSFVEIEYSDMAEQMLSRSEVLHIRKDDQVYVLGDDALNFANIFNQETRRPMSQGILSSDEQSAIPMMKLIIEPTTCSMMSLIIGIADCSSEERMPCCIGRRVSSLKMFAKFRASSPTM